MWSSSRASKRALLRRPELDGLAVGPDLERPEDPELHHAPTIELTPTYSELNDLKRARQGGYATTVQAPRGPLRA